jgi:hypothetical protein
MVVLPRKAHSVAVARMFKGVSAAADGVAVFDDTVQRPIATPQFQTIDSIQFSKDSSTLYGYNNETTGFDFYQMSVDSTGVTIGTSVGSLITGFRVNIHFDKGTGLIYGDNGGAIDPVALTLVGTYAASGLAAPDSGVGRTFFVFPNFPSGDTQLEAFDQTRFTPQGVIDLGSFLGTPASFVRWGPAGLAFRTTGPTGQIFLVSSPLVLPPSPTSNPVPVLNTLSPPSVKAGGPNFLMLVNGANFVPGVDRVLERTPSNNSFRRQRPIARLHSYYRHPPGGNCSSEGGESETRRRCIGSCGVYH